MYQHTTLSFKPTNGVSVIHVAATSGRRAATIVTVTAEDMRSTYTFHVNPDNVQMMRVLADRIYQAVAMVATGDSE